MPFITPLEDMFKKNPIQKWSELHPDVGNEFYALDGSLVRRGDKALPAHDLRPAVLANSKVVVGDLIPSTSWGASLSNMLTWDSWDALRKPLIKMNSNVCELCGSKCKRIEVHEKWLYNVPIGDGAVETYNQKSALFGTQLLNGLMTLCSYCHRCFHLGREEVNGTLNESLERLAILNNWHPENVRRYHTAVFTRWRSNSNFLWRLDLANIDHPDGGVTLKAQWRESGDGSRVLTAKTQWSDELVTVLLNIPWRFEGEVDFRAPNAP
ncbi:TPA: hypothetical protein L5T32_004150 [Pseudomonas aeruginosa]|nr:hypothetical protein [Pseudomonas aeruginosa]